MSDASIEPQRGDSESLSALSTRSDAVSAGPKVENERQLVEYSDDGSTKLASRRSRALSVERGRCGNSNCKGMDSHASDSHTKRAAPLICQRAPEFEKKRKTELEALLQYIEDFILGLDLLGTPLGKLQSDLEILMDCVGSVHDFLTEWPDSDAKPLMQRAPISDRFQSHLTTILVLCHKKGLELRSSLDSLDVTHVMKAAIVFDSVVREVTELCETDTLDSQNERLAQFHLNMGTILRELEHYEGASRALQSAEACARAAGISNEGTRSVAEILMIIGIQEVFVSPSTQHEELLEEVSVSLRRYLAGDDGTSDTRLHFSLRVVEMLGTARSICKEPGEPLQYLEFAYEGLKLMESARSNGESNHLSRINFHSTKQQVLFDMADCLYERKEVICALKCLDEAEKKQGLGPVPAPRTERDPEEALEMDRQKMKLRVKCLLAVDDSSQALSSFLAYLRLSPLSKDEANDGDWGQQTFRNLLNCLPASSHDALLDVGKSLLEAQNYNLEDILVLAEAILSTHQEVWIRHVLLPLLDQSEVRVGVLQGGNREKCQALGSLLYTDGASSLLADPSGLAIPLLHAALQFSGGSSKYRVAATLVCASLLAHSSDAAESAIAVCKKSDSDFVLNEILSLWLAMERGEHARAIKLIRALPTASGFHPSLLQTVVYEAKGRGCGELAIQALVQLRECSGMRGAVRLVILQNILFCEHLAMKNAPIQERYAAMRHWIKEAVDIPNTLPVDGSTGAILEDSGQLSASLSWLFDFSSSECANCLRGSEKRIALDYSRAAVSCIQSARRMNAPCSTKRGGDAEQHYVKILCISVACVLDSMPLQPERDRASLLEAREWMSELKRVLPTSHLDISSATLMQLEVEIACRLKDEGHVRRILEEVERVDANTIHGLLKACKRNGMEGMLVNLMTTWVRNAVASGVSPDVLAVVLEACLHASQSDSQLAEVAECMCVELERGVQGRDCEAIHRLLHDLSGRIRRRLARRRHLGRTISVESLQSLLERAEKLVQNCSDLSSDVVEDRLGCLEGSALIPRQAVALLNLDCDDIDELCLDF